MIEHNQRFMPVVKDETIVGAITRTDIMRARHEDITGTVEASPYRISKRPHARNLRNILRERLPKRIESLLQEIGAAADSMGVAAFAVGGFVRDLLLGVENYDVDIVIEGDGIAFAENVAAAAGARVRSHQRFGTAVIIFPDGFKMDVATARTEYYEYPTALPTVELSSIRKDLYRRDFTINTLAIKLNKKDFGYLIDFFGGQRDLKEKTVRVLHNLSFIEDPTRIYRAIRFEQRLGFRIARHTQNLIRSATKIDLFQRLAGRRLFTELVLLMSEEDPAKPISRLAEFDLLRFVHPSLQWDDETAALFQGVKDALAWYRLLFLNKQYEPWQVYFFALTDRLSLKATVDMCERLAIREKFLEKVISMKKETPLLLQGLSLQGLFKMRSVKPSRLYGLLKGHPQETLLYLMAKADNEEAKRGISLYLSHLQDIRLSITGKDLAQLGVKPGPLYGKIMEQILWAKLDGLVKTREEEMEFAKGILEK
jgi:tRNA nucleotidyltransferase (CCA-adding enzyme)